MPTEEIVMIGATGHLQSVMDSALAMGCYHVGAIVGDAAALGREFFGVRVSETIEALPRLYERGMRHAFVSAGTIGGYGNREAWYLLAKQIGFDLVNIIDPTAAISPYAQLGKGVFAGKNAVINAYASIGDMVIINTGAIVEHADIIEDFVHIAPGCSLSGGVRVCRGAHLGTCTAVRQNVTIGAEALVGVGSVVLENVPARMVAYGNPCRVRGPVG